MRSNHRRGVGESGPRRFGHRAGHGAGLHLWAVPVVSRTAAPNDPPRPPDQLNWDMSVCHTYYYDWNVYTHLAGELRGRAQPVPTPILPPPGPPPGTPFCSPAALVIIPPILTDRRTNAGPLRAAGLISPTSSTRTVGECADGEIVHTGARVVGGGVERQTAGGLQQHMVRARIPALHGRLGLPHRKVVEQDQLHVLHRAPRRAARGYPPPPHTAAPEPRRTGRGPPPPFPPPRRGCPLISAASPNHPVVRPAADPDGVLCSARRPGSVLRVSRMRARVLSDGVHPLSGGRGDPGEVTDQVEHRALGGEETSGVALQPQQVCPASGERRPRPGRARGSRRARGLRRAPSGPRPTPAATPLSRRPGRLLVTASAGAAATNSDVRSVAKVLVGVRGG